MFGLKRYNVDKLKCHAWQAAVPVYLYGRDEMPADPIEPVVLAWLILAAVGVLLGSLLLALGVRAGWGFLKRLGRAWMARGWRVMGRRNRGANEGCGTQFDYPFAGVGTVSWPAEGIPAGNPFADGDVDDMWADEEDEPAKAGAPNGVLMPAFAAAQVEERNAFDRLLRERFTPGARLRDALPVIEREAEHPPYCDCLVHRELNREPVQNSTLECQATEDRA